MKILVLRTGRMYQMLELDNYLKCTYEAPEIFYVIQPSVIGEFEKIAEVSHLLVLEDNSFEYRLFNKDSGIIKAIAKAKCDVLYVPTSREVFDDMDLLRIANRINFKRFIHYSKSQICSEVEIDKSEFLYASILSSKWFYNLLFILERIVSFKKRWIS